MDLWIVGLLKVETHPSHGGLDEIMEFINYIQPKKTIFTHMTALIDEKQINELTPHNVIAGYDGMEIEI